MFRKITKERVITSDNKYPSRARSTELTEEVIINIENTCLVLNNFFEELNEICLNEEREVLSLKISSGFRPSFVNSNIINASKRSGHLTGIAVDFKDSNHKLYDVIFKYNFLLKKYNLFLEDKNSTKFWVHLDLKQRSKREINIFIP